MSSLDNFLSLQEQVYYVRCGFCSTILLVNVPCSSSLSMAVTVTCGHCAGVLTVNISKPCPVTCNLLSSTNYQQQDMLKCEPPFEEAANTFRPLLHFSSDEDKNDDSLRHEQVIHKPPERKQRPPSAYNRFIKEEIKRLKIKHPDITHKQAFSSAAKNWSHCPQNQHKGGGGDPRRAVNSTYN
ncbi:protein YABBY 7-like [Andrographis paniculata]|uniref:protein YABBY 7-like n=1 Tax=Andrographis paniculata TaxID=175694 RepID=UPI0021E70066|nr:protein YABBY 7-like [Andrographis paniculata]XP_051122559.1 protein YABBY 7-like [Andrographis paniculata]